MQFFRDNLKYFRCDKIAASLPLLLRLLIYFEGQVCDLKLENNVNWAQSAQDFILDTYCGDRPVDRAVTRSSLEREV